MKNPAKKWEKIAIFISSTFNDMHAERDYLVKDVFPELREYRKRATYWIGKELAGEKNVRTGWLYHQKQDGRARNYDVGFLYRYNAETITYNYMVLMSDIFCDIARMTEGMGHWHIEFKDALNRLTDSKADKLLYMDGPHRAGHTRSLLMRELMLYRG